MKRIVLSTLILALLFLATPQRVSACSCALSGAPAEELTRSAAVFSGKVVGSGFNVVGFLRGHSSQYQVTFDVDRVWKGSLAKIVAVTTATHGATCGYLFQSGEQYLVYAYRLGDGALETGICTPTATLGDAQADLIELGAGSPPLQPPGILPFSESLCLVGMGSGGVALLGVIGMARAARRRRAITL